MSDDFINGVLIGIAVMLFIYYILQTFGLLP